ncbi:MAG TPA: copper-binding protein [Bryobacteraceae bacterium]|nr:copper-binding protein [Bryobacteraceae bacterium]
MTTFKRIAAIVAMAVICLVQAGLAQNKKPMTMKGKVEGVDVAAGTLKVNNEKVEGWMDSMVMDYKVDNPDVLKTLKTGDQITATVYEGDMVLHKVAKASGKK